MNDIEKGNIYTVHRMRSGSSSKGPWELLVFVDNKKKNDITVFPRNIPSGAREGQKVKIEDICCVKFGYKRDKNEKWEPRASMEAIVTPIESELDGNGGMEISGTEWEEFKGGGNPWDDLDELPL